MKVSLKTIAIIIGLVMLGVFFYQLYWLNELYRTTSRQFDKNVYEAMDIADQNELLLRIEEVKSNEQGASIAMNVSMEEDSTGKEVYYAHEQGEMDTVNVSVSDNAGFNTFKENIKTTEKLAAYIKKTMHMSVDLIKNININVYDSLLSAELKKDNIIRPYQIFIVKTDNDSVCFSAANNKGFNTAHAKKFDFLYDIYGTHAYRLFIKNPNRQVLSQMAGILFSSVIIFIFLIYTFVYLLKTIRKLQTEEELKTNFTNNMTHELKTPISVSYAAIDALLVADQSADKERQKKYLNIAKDQMEQLTGLVEQILSMSQKDNKKIDLKPEKTDLLEMVRNLIDRAKLFSEKEVAFEMDFKVKTVVADKMHLFNMLNNLVENSIRYGNEIVHVKISSYEDDELISIRVEDDGPGIDPKYQTRVFDKFYRIPTGDRYNVKGYGLGLFYVKEMTELHGGKVLVESHSGKGAALIVKIPKKWKK